MANSVKTFSGYDTDSRTSSKVLRPPGGGYTDIFGIKDIQVSAPAPESTPEPVSTPPMEAAPEPASAPEPVSAPEPAPAPAPAEPTSGPSSLEAPAAPQPESISAPESAPVEQEAPAPAAPTPETSSPEGSSEGGEESAPAGAGNQERVRIDPTSGRIMSAPTARAGRVPPGGFSSGPLW
jgi:outer membrane biosynthesis protein TonB